jgi:site-specific DNA-methyltransferase (adenine-specific)
MPLDNNETKNKKLIQNNTNDANVSHSMTEHMTTNYDFTNVDIQNTDGIEYLKSIPDNKVDLVLTDPPYIISKDSGMNTLHNKVESGDTSIQKTEEDWEAYKIENNIEDDSKKKDFMTYGSIYGLKYSVKTQYGDWDSEFTLDALEMFMKEYYRILRKGGTAIIFFDIWKITDLKNMMERCKFKQIRFIEWIKTNPQPVNQSVNYLSNCREIALLGVKGGKPTFNSKYDKGIYEFPLQSGGKRFHPTQKNLKMFEALIAKHSNEGDLVVDTFLGSGTTALACASQNRKFKGCEVSKEYFDKMNNVIQDIKNPKTKPKKTKKKKDD